MLNPCLPPPKPLIGEDAKERSYGEGKAQQSPGPLPALTHRSRSWHCWRAAPWGSGHTHRRARGRRPRLPGSGAGDRDLAWRACEKLPGSGPRGGENDAPQRGKVDGEESLESWATPRAGGSALQLPEEGRTPSRGAEAAPLPARESPPHAPGRR